MQLPVPPKQPIESDVENARRFVEILSRRVPVVNFGLIGILEDNGEVVIHAKYCPGYIYVYFHIPDRRTLDHVALFPKIRIAPTVQLVYANRVWLNGKTGIMEQVYGNSWANIG